ncbi:MAG: HEAT repeat domain-containing protein, partial [Planctomycetes bacterium]|nr:HEAT repeat domain-containing protein [Planctomycetota bacterium]
MAVLASLCLSLLPQVLQGSDIKLPPKTAAERPKEPAVRPLTEIERFRRDLLEMQGPPARVDQRLQEMAAAYAGPAMEALILEVARSARANEMQNLMVVARRFGGASPRVADELLFQLLARPLAEATRPVVETMAVLKGDAKKAALRECIRGRIPAARRHAVEVLVPMLRPEDDLAFALELSRDQALDLQMRGIELLGAMPVEASAARLCELLAKDMALAGVASQTLVAMGTAALPSLQAVLAAPPVDRRFAYAAFTTARIAEADSRLLPENLAPALVALLADPEILTRSLVAVPLADLMFRGVPALAGKDVAVVEALLEVVQPTTFVPNPDLLRRPTEDRLVRATGRLLGGESLPWRDWWKDQQAGFVSVRARVEFTDADALLAVVSWRQEGRHVRLLAEGFVDLAPMKDATEVVLSKSEMLELLAALQAGGLHDEVAMRVGTGLPRQRCLALQFPQGRTQVTMPLGEHPRFDALVAAVQKRVDEQLWQLYRDPQKEADRGAFWRAERAYREANPGAIAHGRRFVGRVLAQWPTLAPMLRAKALDFVANHQDRKQLLTESDGEVALALLGKLPELGDLDLRLLELVAGVPGDRVWRGAVKLAAQRQGTMRNAGRAVFAVLGPDAVLASLQDANPLVRQAGVREIMIVRDLRAADRLVELLADDDLDVRLVAAEACGHMQIPAAGKRLVDLIVAD